MINGSLKKCILKGFRGVKKKAFEKSCTNVESLYAGYQQLNEMFEKQGETMFRLVDGLSGAVEREFPRQLDEMRHGDIVVERPYEWVCGFIEKHGRPPRVLHISNVANNAYKNAGLFRSAGIEADVICNDLYHIMSCPEWEDADFDAAFSNQFFPDWSQVDLKGYDRPRWFAQGPLLTCIYYLVSRCLRRPLPSSLWWCEMAYQQKRLSENGGQDYSVGPELPRFIKHDDYDFDRRAQELVKIFAERLPGWPGGQLAAEDLVPWRWAMPYWRHLLKQYDVVQAYGTEPIVAMIAGVPYVAFEHGTLREIPYQNSNIGRASALAYTLAEHVFVTNSDCVYHAHRLAGTKVTFINHPHDEHHGLAVEGVGRLRSELSAALDADFLFFFPTRHDWVNGGTFGNKGNDIFLRAFCRLREERFRVGMVCCTWGNDTRESMKVLAERNCSDFVRWVQPQGMVAFIRLVKACDIVVDQFHIGAFGGVFFKSLAAGAALCSYLEEKEMIERYGECPPLLNCRSENEIVEAIKTVLGNPDHLASLRVEARKWVERHHRSDETLIKQFNVYTEVMKLNSAQT
jgi:glycosyltransferase involved in cell wall biosynthesis